MSRFVAALCALAVAVTVVGANHAAANTVGHHGVDYLGTMVNADGTSTALWAVTEHGCDGTSVDAPVSSSPQGNGKGNGRGGGGGGGKGGTNCNSMSHIAFSDFLCDPAHLLWPDGSGAELFWTVMDIVECVDGTYSCLSTVYKPNYGASRPDGAGDWIKYSNNTGGDPPTVQLETSFTHVFAITFVDGGQYVLDATINAAIKIGRTVVVEPVDGPSCAQP